MAGDKELSMTRQCELTGKLPMSGQLRSHAENKT
jgi:large subunit ribosomal protein L28